MSWIECAQEYAAVVTAGVAVLALVVAGGAILSQRKSARCRATVDFFMKTEMDDPMVAAYRDFERCGEELRSYIDIEAFMKNPELRKPIQRYLNIHELMAVGIHTKIFDQRICYSYWADILASAHNNTGRVIAHVRVQPGCSGTYEDLLRLQRRWSGRRWIWQKWRSGRWPFQL